LHKALNSRTKVRYVQTFAQSEQKYDAKMQTKRNTKFNSNSC